MNKFLTNAKNKTYEAINELKEYQKYFNDEEIASIMMELYDICDKIHYKNIGIKITKGEFIPIRE